MKTFRELVSSFPKELSYRLFEYIFLSSNRVTNLTEYENHKEEVIDFECNLTAKLKQRLLDTNYPVPRITKCTFFNNRKFQLFEGVFDPRPETELVIEITKKEIKEANITSFSYLDLCSGTGAIYLSVLLELKDQIICSAGIDSSFRASFNTLENLSKSGVKGNHKVYLSSWKSFLDRSNRWEVITMNPPYLDFSEWTQALKFDPRNSLVASKQGVSHYQALLSYLKRNNYWKLVVLECSEYHESYWEEIERVNTNWIFKRYKDYLDKFRVVSITRK